MTEIPEHLLKRSRDRRAALGLGGGEAAPAAEGASEPAPAATPATTGATAAAAPPSGPVGRKAAAVPAEAQQKNAPAAPAATPLKPASPGALAAEALYQRGELSVRDIARNLDISKVTLYSYLRYRGVQIGGSARKEKKASQGAGSFKEDNET